MKVAVPPPASPVAWLDEIAWGYLDAAEVMLLDPEIEEKDIFHLAPAVCVKYRKITPAKKSIIIATQAALTSYVATTGQDPTALVKPHLAFAFCYLTAHFGLDVVTEVEVSDLMDFVVEHEQQLAEMIDAARASA